MRMLTVVLCYLLSVNANRHGRAGPIPPLQLQWMASGLDVGRKRFMVTTTLPGARGLATVNVTMSSEYMDNTKWACFFSFFSLSSFHLIVFFVRGTVMRDRRWMWEDWEVPLMGMHDVKFPNNQQNILNVNIISTTNSVFPPESQMKEERYYSLQW